MAKDKKATARTLDFTNVKDRGEFQPLHRPEGDYRGLVTKVSETETKEGKPQWVYTIKIGSGTYPYRCQFEPNVLWKIRNIFVAAGFSVGKSKLKLDPTRPVGKEVGVSLQDHEYDDKLSSEIASVFPTSELTDSPNAREAEDDEDTDATASDDSYDMDDDEPTPKKKKGKKQAEPEPEPAKKGKKKKGKKVDEMDVDSL